MHHINRREWLVQSGALCLAGNPLLSFSAAAVSPLRSEFRTYRVRVDDASPLLLSRENHALALQEPPAHVTSCLSDLAPGWDGRARFFEAVRQRHDFEYPSDPGLFYWFCAYLQRGDVVICYDDSDICRVAAVADGYCFNAGGAAVHERPLAWFPSTIHRQMLGGAFMSERPTRALHEPPEPRHWLDTEALSALETIIDSRLPHQVETHGLGPHCMRQLNRGWYKNHVFNARPKI